MLDDLINLERLRNYTDMLRKRLAVLMRNKAYTVGSIVQWEGKFLECEVAGTTGLNLVSLDGKNPGDKITDGTVTWSVVNAYAIVKHEVSGYDITQGMNVKVTDKGKLVANDLLKTVRAASTQAELDYLGTKQLTNADIFSKWLPFTCNENGSAWNDLSSSDQASAKASYSFNAVEDAIICNRNNSAFSAFISQDKYAPSFKVEYIIDNRILSRVVSPSITNDDDGLFFILGFMQDSNGVYHTLSIIRTGDTEGAHGTRFAIAYDLFTSWTNNAGSTMKLLATDNTLTQHDWDSTSFATMTVQKTSSTITATTTQINGSTVASTLTYTLPASKPSDLTQEQYDNIRDMMVNPSKIGFGTQSNPSAFRLIKAEGAINGIHVYNPTSLEDVYYEDGVRISATTDTTVFLPQEFIYSNLNRRLYFVNSKREVEELAINTVCHDWKANTAYIEDTLVQYEGDIYRCVQFNADANFDPQKWEKINGGGIDVWTASQSYIVGNIVLYDNTTGISPWAGNTSYAINDKVVHDGRIYECSVANSDSDFTASKWHQVDTAQVNLYKCITANNDANFTPSKWLAINSIGLASIEDIEAMF